MNIAMAPIALSPDLEALVISRFDELVSKGEIIYEPSTTENVEDQGFKVSKPPRQQYTQNWFHIRSTC